MRLKVKLAKAIMRIFPVIPKFDIATCLSENINHKCFLAANTEGKQRMLFEMAEEHYMYDQKMPFDLYFKNYPLKTLLQGKKVLDLGCWCGGESVSYAERWNVHSMYGIDTNEYFVEAARLFASSRKNRKINYNFATGFAEKLPYSDETFDAIISREVFEHVKSLPQAIQECKRTLKTGGMLLSVFPSYYFPFGGAHLGLVTNAPFIQWFFSPQTLYIAYKEILDARGKEAYWYNHETDESREWMKLQVGIGINGTTFSQFDSITEQVGFSEIHILLSPLLSVSSISVKYPIIRRFADLYEPFLAFKPIREYFSHRIVSILIK